MVINSGARFWKKNIYGLAFGWLDFRERGLTGVTDLASWLCCCLLSFCGVSIICARIIRPHQWESLPHMMWSHLIIICNTRRDFVSEPKLCVTRSCRIACHGYTNWCDQKVQDGLSRIYKLVWPESAGWLVTDIQTGVTRKCRMACYGYTNWCNSKVQDGEIMDIQTVVTWKFRMIFAVHGGMNE